MLQYKLKERCINPDSISPIKDYLISLGIKEENIDSFINKPKQEDELSPWLLINMYKAVKMLNYIFTNDKKILLIIRRKVSDFYE